MVGMKVWSFDFILYDTIKDTMYYNTYGYCYWLLHAFYTILNSVKEYLNCSS